jgi:hypothetical protein
VVWTQKIKGKTAKIACENIKIAQLNKNVTPLIFLVILRSLIAKIKISAQDLKNCASKPKNCMSRGKNCTSKPKNCALEQKCKVANFTSDYTWWIGAK